MKLYDIEKVYESTTHGDQGRHEFSIRDWDKFLGDGLKVNSSLIVDKMSIDPVEIKLLSLNFGYVFEDKGDIYTVSKPIEKK